MVEYMKKVAQDATSDLSLEGRNLLSVAYKNVVGARRASLRIIGSIEAKEVEKKSDKQSIVTSYKSKVARVYGSGRGRGCAGTSQHSQWDGLG